MEQEIVTEELIESLRTDAGGWTKKDLEWLGVPWPPRKGWRARIVGKARKGVRAGYEPRAYWPRRHARQGRRYVARAGMDDAGSREQFAAFWAAVEPLVPRPCPLVLDFGCGVGRLAPYIAPMVGGYRGVDIVPDAIAEADRSAGNCLYRHLPADELPFPDDSCDCAVAVTVLQHIPDGDFRRWCDELRRVVRPGGTFIVVDSVPLDRQAPHMHTRTPEAVAGALGAEIASSGLVNADNWVLEARRAG